MTTLLLLDDADAPLPDIAFRDPEWTLTRVESARAARKLLADRTFDLLLVGIDGRGDERDGVASLRKQFPALPILLIAAEEVCQDQDAAVRALMLGAASYVPRGCLASDLEATVRRLLSLTGRMDRRRLAPHLEGVTLSFQLPPERDRVPLIVGYLRDCAVDFGFSGDADAFQLAVAIDEAITNALIHGTLEIDGRLRGEDPLAHNELVERRTAQEPYRSRRIHVSATIKPELLRLVVRDEGPGFDSSSIADPTEPENALRPYGRGVMLMRAFMDEVVYNEQGNEITLVKRRA